MTPPRLCNAKLNFYPRSPCGERRGSVVGSWPLVIFLSTLSLRRATRTLEVTRNSDDDFYPRSPCGERQRREASESIEILHFYPRSPCGERQTIPRGGHINKANFYPRSPCGERHIIPGAGNNPIRISIHALLAESDFSGTAWVQEFPISIHALLAESDPNFR